MRAGTRVSLAAVTVACAMAVGVAAQPATPAQDPYVGTWTMNAAKSTFSAPAPKSRVLTITAAGANAIKVEVAQLGADGARTRWSFSSSGDGKEVPVTGNPDMDTASRMSQGPRAGKTVFKKQGKVVMEVSTEVSADGKTLTSTSKGVDAQGNPVTSKVVYDRT